MSIFLFSHGQLERLTSCFFYRAAYLAQYDGYLELYEYLLSRGGDPSIRTKDYDPYLNPGRKTPVQVSIDDDNVRGAVSLSYFNPRTCN